MPETSVYRKYTEQIVRERAAVLTQVMKIRSIKFVLNLMKSKLNIHLH